jgi:anti-repressor protein
MEELVFKSENGAPVTNSLLVAKKFEKEHKHVLRDIENLSCSENFRQSNFGLSYYISQQNKELPMYVMTKDGFSFLVMGYTGREAGKFKEDFIEAFNKMEETIRTGGFQIPKNYSEALMLAAKQAEQIEQQQEQLSLQAPKVAFADAVTASEKSILVAELAKILRQNGVTIGQNRLYTWLRENGYLLSRGSYYNQPSQTSIEQGLFEVTKQDIPYYKGGVFTSYTSRVTGRGQLYFINKFITEPALQKNS